MVETAAALAVGSVLFWLLIGLVALVMFAWVEYNRGWFAGLTVVGTLLLLQFFGDVNAFGYIKEDPIGFVGMTIGYFAVGFIWSFGKYWFFGKAKGVEYRQALARFEEHPNRDERNRPKEEEYKPKFLRNTDRLVGLVIYWPWSMLWTLTSDWVRDVVEAGVRMFRGAYELSGNHGFATGAGKTAAKKAKGT